MPKQRTLVVVSDIHYAGPGEQARPRHEARIIQNPLLRGLVQFYRHYIWLREPLGHNNLLDRFVAEAGAPDLVVANGDYSCDTAFVGVCDDAAFASAALCLGKLRAHFPGKLALVFGDHELGKISLVGGCGGMRLSSWRRACGELGLEPFWRLELGCYVLIAVVSSLVALPVYQPEILPEEAPEWEELRRAHLAEISRAFSALRPDQKVLLFCHDPSALPFLWQEEPVRGRLWQIETTVIGHLHTPLILWKSRLLAGMPAIGFLGNSIRRMSTALRDARRWKPFNVRLCPSLAGIELLKDGGFLEAQLDDAGLEPARWRLRPLPR